MSVSTAFAASDDAAVSEVDEIAIDEDILSAEDSDVLEAEAVDVQSAGASEVVTNDTFSNYFDENGFILSNVTATELEFDGDFSDVNVSTIYIDKAVSFLGKNATFDGVSFVVLSDNVTIDGFTLVQNNDTSLFEIASVDNVAISNNKIEYYALSDEDSYAVLALDVDNLKLINNTIYYVGNTTGASVNNAVYVDKSRNVEVKGNGFYVNMPATSSVYDENWNSQFFSDAIVFTASENITFSKNVIDVGYIDCFGNYDSINVLVLGNSNYLMDYDTFETLYPNVCKNVVVEENEISALGHNFIYGISVAAENASIINNVISISSDYNYVDGIQVSGPSSDVTVENNELDLVSPNAAYGIYAYQYGGAIVNSMYVNNTIIATSYAVCGMEIVENNPSIYDNKIYAYGNHTTGMAVNMIELGAIAANTVSVYGSNVGNDSTGDSLIHSESTAIAVKGDAAINENTIESTAIGVNLLQAGEIILNDNTINVFAEGDVDNYAVCVNDIDSLSASGNFINFTGATNGTTITNAVLISGTDNATFDGNILLITLPSAHVPWVEVPAGSGNWVSFPVSEGIVVSGSDNLDLFNNIITIEYGNVSGTYDTIYAVSIKDSDNATVYGNIIDAKGHTYIYGLQISGDNFNIYQNLITTESDNYYANGIDIEGPASGVVYSNNISAKGVESAYAIYSGMNGQNTTVNYGNNVINAEAYLAFGMSLGDVEDMIYNNTISAIGNYTMGIASKVQDLMAVENTIDLISYEVGNQSMWEAFGVETNGILIADGNAILYNNTIFTAGRGVNAAGGNVSVLKNDITLVANEDADAFAVYANGAESLDLKNNTIVYAGATEGKGVNNAVYICGIPETVVSGNKFDLALVSSYVPWVEVPAGSGNWVSFPVSEGIVIENCEGATFTENEVNVMYNDVVGDYDTIYAISIKDSDHAAVSENIINATGHTYIYGIQMNGDDFFIANNVINVESDNYYANGIDIEGPAAGAVEGNTIMVKGVESAYAVYSGMNGQNTTVTYKQNLITGEAYNVFGMSLGDVESTVEDNTISLEGNYTTGIAYRGEKLGAYDNLIFVNGSNVGNQSIWESFGVETIGIKVVKGISEIVDNSIIATSDYAVDVRNTTASVHDNFLDGKTYIGDESVANATNADVHDNTPLKAQTVILITEVSGDLTVKGVLKDTEGNVISGVEIICSVNGTNSTVKTDENGTFELVNLTNGEINMAFDGGPRFMPTNATITLKDIAPVAPVKVESHFNITGGVITINGYAVDTKAGEEGIYYATELLDADGNPIKGVKIQFAVNDKVYNRTTKENGSFNPYKLNMIRAGRYTMAFYFAGDDNYTGAFASVCVDLDKKPIKIKASNKSYKASTKTKKYTVTLSTKVCSSHDGKAHLRSGLKVTLTVNGKTYNGKTNSKGQVTFKITNLKNKAKYKAKISYAGDATYESASKTVTITAK